MPTLLLTTSPKSPFMYSLTTSTVLLCLLALLLVLLLPPIRANPNLQLASATGVVVTGNKNAAVLHHSQSHWSDVRSTVRKKVSSGGQERGGTSKTVDTHAFDYSRQFGAWSAVIISCVLSLLVVVTPRIRYYFNAPRHGYSLSMAGTLATSDDVDDPRYDPELDDDSPEFNPDKWIAQLYPKQWAKAHAPSNDDDNVNYEEWDEDYFVEEPGYDRRESFIRRLALQPGMYVSIDPSVLAEGYTTFEFLTDVFPKRWQYFVWECLHYPPLFRSVISEEDKDIILGTTYTSKTERRAVQKRVAESLVQYIVECQQKLTESEQNVIRWWATLATESMPQWQTKQFKEEFSVPYYVQLDLEKELAKAEAAKKKAAELELQKEEEWLQSMTLNM